ncbi:MAG: hypothetical protein AABW90_00075 [Nanoarchaeota archaeon]
MVKIIGKSLEEITNDEREDKLIKIAERVLGEEFKVINSITYIALIPKKTTELYKTQINVSLIHLINMIEVNNPKWIDYAIRLAEAYESSGEPEFTVKKNYDE